MNRIFPLVLGAFLSLGSFCYADNFRDYDFEQERMLLSEDGIYILSSFDNSDGLTAYSYFGTRLWETTFHAKVTSWKVVGEYVFVFSKHRSGYKTYLTCLNRYTGAVLWERP